MLFASNCVVLQNVYEKSVNFLVSFNKLQIYDSFNHDRRRFGSVLDIVPLADSVTKLTARCELCGRPAYFTLRKTEQTETELIGGADVYMPVCRQHYVNGQVVMEAARLVLESKKETLELYSEIAAP